MKKSELINRTFEEILYYVVPLAEKDILDKFLEVEELNEQISFSKEHREKMKILFNKQYRKERMIKIIKFAKKTAIWLFIISAIVGTISFYSVEAFRLKVMNLGLQFKDGYANIFIEKTKTDLDSADNKDTLMIGNMEFGYIPNGFELEKNIDDMFFKFKNIDNPNLYISLQIMMPGSEITTDTEDGYITMIKIKGDDAFLFKKNNEEVSLFWNKGNEILVLSGNITDSEIIKVAENIKIY